MNQLKGKTKMEVLQVSARTKIMDDILTKMASAQINGLRSISLHSIPPFTSIEIQNDLLAWGYDVHREVDLETSKVVLDIVFDH